MDRLTKSANRTSTVQPLDVETLRPLVDLAYWSTFLEVRRDCAAAFATLSMNEANLPILSQAGTLGALLALIGVGNGRNDSQVHKDAATALSYLVALDDIKLRLLKAPDGLKALFHMTKSPNVGVKRAAIKTLHNLSELNIAQDSIVDHGGIRHLFNLTNVKDEKTKRRAAKVLRKLASNSRNKLKMMELPSLRQTVHLLTESPDMVLKHDLMEMVIQLATQNNDESIEEAEPRRKLIVQNGIIVPLLLHLDLSIASIETALSVVRTLVLLAACTDNKIAMVQQGVVGTLIRTIFEDIAYARKNPGLTSNNLHQRSKKSAAVARKHKRKMEQELIRLCLQIFHELSSLDINRDILVEWGLLDKLIDPDFAHSHDRRTRRTVGNIISTLAENKGDPCPRHQDMVSKGVLPTLITYLEGHDYELRTRAAKTLASLAVNDGLKNAICQPTVLHALVNLSTLDDREVKLNVVRAMAELADVLENAEMFERCGAIGPLVRMLAPSNIGGGIRLEAARALSNLSISDLIKKNIVSEGGLGYLIRLSKSGRGLEKLYALATLTNLSHDAAALRIQMVFRGYLGKKAYRLRQEMERKNNKK